jgi:hypothetical protein
MKLVMIDQFADAAGGRSLEGLTSQDREPDRDLIQCVGV